MLQQASVEDRLAYRRDEDIDIARFRDDCKHCKPCSKHNGIPLNSPVE